MLRWIIVTSLLDLLTINSIGQEYLNNGYSDTISIPKSEENVNSRLMRKLPNVNTQEYAFKNGISSETQQRKNHLSKSNPDHLVVNEIKGIYRVLLYILDTNMKILKELRSKDNVSAVKLTSEETKSVIKNNNINETDSNTRRTNIISNRKYIPSSLDTNTNLRLLANNYQGKFLPRLRQYINHKFNQEMSLDNAQPWTKEVNNQKQNWTSSLKRKQRIFISKIPSISNMPKIYPESSLSYMSPTLYNTAELADVRHIFKNIPPGLLPKEMPKKPYSASYSDGKNNWNININPGYSKQAWQKNIKNTEAEISENDVI